MFADAFLPNLAVFLAAQLTAWVYLRTGLVGTGVATIVATWLAADVALVARFAYDETGLVYLCALIVFQAWTLVVLLRLIVGRWRRSRPAFVARRTAGFRDAFTHWLRGDLAAAASGLRALVSVDPWDLRSRLLLAKVLKSDGQRRPARRQLAAARRLDREDRYGDWIAHELDERTAEGGSQPADATALEPSAPAP